jgi:hypothetical protein
MECTQDEWMKHISLNVSLFSFVIYIFALCQILKTA